MDIELKLKQYRQLKSSLELLKLEERRIIKELCDIEEISGVSASQLSEVPRSITNKFNSAVENEVVTRENSISQVNTLKKDLKSIEDNIFTTMYEIGQIDTLLDSLTDEQKFIIEHFFIKGFIWRIVCEKYRNEFGKYREPRTLRYIKNKAIMQMEKLIG